MKPFAVRYHAFAGLFMAGLVAAFLGLAAGLSGAALAGEAAVSAILEPSEISVGESARLTITGTGDSLPPVTPPVIPGLDFTPVGQSRRIEVVNGVIRSSSSMVYQVRAREAGTYVISSLARGVEPLQLRVSASGAGPGGAAAGSASGGVRSGSTPPRGVPPEAADGAAFVRLRAPKHDLYVGESIPVDIEVGTRDGVVASLNGPPSLKGDAFTLDKLSPEPDSRTEEMIDGKRFTVFTWHSVLAAVKPATLSLTMETPLTVRIQTERPHAQFLDDADFADLFNDPAFQGFFGGSMEKDITVASPPANFVVRDVPAAGKPAGYSGAVGDFKISAELLEPKVTEGDPVTVRMKVSGEGNFDRVMSPMFGSLEHFKTYQPTARFTPAGSAAYRGEKVFEQPVVPTQPGRQSLPPLSFSFFDPSSGRYETARSDGLTLDVIPAAPVAASGNTANQGAAAVSGLPVPGTRASPPDHSPTGVAARAGLRADHAPGGPYDNSLLPRYFVPQYLALPSLVLLAFPGAWFWLRRRERRDAATVTAQVDLVGALESASQAGNGPEFFQAAKRRLQSALGARWQLSPEAVTLAEIDARLGADSDVRRLFVMADEARYAGRRFGRAELEKWRPIVDRLTALPLVMLALLVASAMLPGSAAAEPAAERPETESLSAASLYNRANAYARDGNAGMAILFYERARVLAPRDPDIAVNLREVRASAGLPAESGAMWLDHLRLGDSRLLLWVGTAGLGLMGGGALWVRFRRAHARVGWVLVAAGVPLAGAALCDLLGSLPLLHEAVIVHPTTARVTPVAGGDAAFALPAGQVVKLAASYGAFRLIESGGGSGWVSEGDVAPVL